MIKLANTEKNFLVFFFLNSVKTTMVIPIFPLNGIIFFPDTSLPLNIFEPRYIEMVNYALNRDSKIGMIQQRESGGLYSVGCMGKITTYKKTSDGRYLITLVGQDYFKVDSEVELKEIFRSAKVKIYSNKIEKGGLSLNKIKTSELLREYEKFMNNKGLEVNLNYFKQAENSNIIKFIAMTSPLSSAEKQMLLETASFKELFDKLLTLLQYNNLVGSSSVN